MRVDVIEGNDRNDAVFPSDLFTVLLLLLEMGEGYYLKGRMISTCKSPIQKLHVMITHWLEAGICFLL